LSDPLIFATKRLREAGIDNPRLEARVLWEAAKAHVACGEPCCARPENEAAVHRLHGYVTRRMAHEPVAYITGAKEFWSLDFEVGRGVLIPRPETEIIVEEALKRFPDRSAPLRFLDLGTGSGCLLVTLLTEFPGASGIGIDRSPEALAIAARNLARHGLTGRGEIRQGDWDKDVTGPFDLVVSNPPYIPTADVATLEADVREHEPMGALDGGTDGLDAIRALAPALKRLEARYGLIEIGIGQGEAASAVMVCAGHHVEAIVPDLAGIPRILAVSCGKYPTPKLAKKLLE